LLFSPIRATYSAHLILRVLIALTYLVTSKDHTTPHYVILWNILYVSPLENTSQKI